MTTSIRKPRAIAILFLIANLFFLNIGTSGQTTVTLTQPDQLIATISGGGTICSGESTNITVTLSGGTSPYTVTYNATQHTGSGPILTIPVSPLVTTTYDNSNIAVTDVNSCSSTISGSAIITVNQTAAIASVTLPFPTLCIGGTVSPTLNGLELGGGSGAWSSTGGITVDGAGNITANTAGPASVTYTITSGCGGTVSASKTLFVIPNSAVASVTGPAQICVGGTGTYKANGQVQSGGTGAWSSSNSAVASVDGFGAVTTHLPGTANIIFTITGGCNGPASAQQTLTVNAAPEITTQPTHQTVIYGAASVSFSVDATVDPYIPAPTYQWQVSTGSGFNDIPGEISSTLTIANPAVSMNGYTYHVILSNDCGSVTSNEVSLTVDPLAITVTADPGQTKIYGEANPAVYTYTSSPAIGSSLANGEMIFFTGALSRSSGEDAGTYAIAQNDLDNINYSITYNADNYIITPLTVTVTADAGQTKVYGEADPVTYTYTSLPAVGSLLANGDVISFTGALSRTSGEDIGTYAIEQNDLANSNYSLTYNADNFIITPLAVTVTVDAGQTKVYGEADPAVFTYTSSPAVGSSLANGDVVSFTGALNRVAGEAAGTYAIGQNDLANNNYNPITFIGADFTITNIPIIASASAGVVECVGGSTILTVTASGGDGALEYSLDGGVNYQVSNLFTVNAAGSPYVITVKDEDGFTVNTNVVIVTEQPSPTISLSSGAESNEQIICIGNALNDITYFIGGNTTGATVTALPSGLTGSFTAGVFTISGTPGAPGIYSYTVTTEGPCVNVSLSGTITVNDNATISLSSASGTDGQTVCINAAIDNITYAIGGGATNATVAGLPNGVTGIYNAGILTISGTPDVSGIFGYTVSTAGPCDIPTATGTITINGNSSISLSSSVESTLQTVCINNAIEAITYDINDGATGGHVTGLPDGVIGTYDANTGEFMISGTPTESGTFNYTLTTEGPCNNLSLQGTIIVNANSTITLSSSTGTDGQTVCIDNPISAITYSIGDGGTGALITAGGLPDGVSGSFNGGVFTIIGTPTESGTFSYTITTTGPCINPTISGTITVNANSTISLSSASGTDGQTVCIDNALDDIDYIIGEGGTGASITAGGLPAGVTGTFNTGVFTISGTPTESGTFNYTVTTDGPCTNVSLSGTITVNPDATISLSSGPASQSVCINNDILLVAYTAGGSASNAFITAGALPAGVSGSFNGGVFTISGTPTESGTFNYTITTAGTCVNPSVSGTIIVHPSPLVSAVSNASYCNNNSGAAIAFSTSTPGTVVYNWTSTADIGFGTFGTGNIAAFTATNNSNSVIIATVSVTATINGCTGAATTFTITVNPSPLVNAVGNLTYCDNGPGAAINFTSPISGGTVIYNWASTVDIGFGLNGNGNIGAFTAVNTSINPITTNVTVTPSLGGCAGTPITFTLTVNPKANAGTISGSSTICTGSTSQLSTNGSIGGTWSSTNPAIASVNPATGQVTGLATGSTTIFYTVSNICGAASASFTVSVNPNAIAGTINGPATLCQGTTTLLTTNGNSGGTWYTISSNVSITPSGMITGLSAGTATVYYYVSNSCGFDVSLPYNVTINAGSNPGTIIAPVSMCAGTVSLFFSSGTQGGTWASSNTGVANIGTSNGFALAMNPGTTTITYTVAANSCSSGPQVTYFTLTVNPAGNAGIISGTSNICAGTSTLLSTTGSSGGTWLSGNTSVATVNPVTGNVTGVAPGAVLITYQISNSCGSGNATFPIMVSQGANAGTISGSSTVCAGSAISLTSNGTPGGSWSSSNPAAAQVDGNGVVIGTGAGNTTITYTVTSFCSSSSTSKTISVNALPNAGIVNGASTICAGLSTTFTTNGNGGGIWTSSNPAAASVNSTSGVVTGVAAGNATITYSVTTGCGTASQSANITVNPVLNAGTISGGSTLCMGSTLDLNSSGNSGGQWTSSHTGIASIDANSGLVTSVAPGNATITYTVSNTCGTATATQLITINALPNAGTVTGVSTICDGSSASFTSNGNGGGSWSSSNTAAATVNAASGLVTAIAPGSSTITYTVTTGCGTSTASSDILVNPLASAGTITGPNAVCVNATINLSSEIGGGTWSSNSPSIAIVSSSGIVTGKAAGIATITYTITTACGNNAATFAVTVNAAPNAGMIPGTTTTVCVGSSIFLNNVGGMVNGTWRSVNPARASVDPVTGEVTGISAGSTIIAYTVTNSCGTSSASLPIMVNSLPNAGNISGLSSVCTGANINLSASGDGGGTWTSSNSLVVSVNPTTGVVTGVGEGSATIIYTVGSAAVCGTSSATHLVTVNPLANAGTLNGTTTVCVGLSTTLTSSGSVGGTWSSSNSAIASVNPASGVVTAIAAGSAIINYTVTNICGSATASATVTVNPLPNAGSISGATSVCAGSTINLGSNVSGGTWSSSTHSVATIGPNTGIVTGIAAGNTTITYTVTTSCGTASTNYSISVNPLPAAGTISGTTYLCTGSTTNLYSNLNGGTWSSSNTTAATINPTTGVVTGHAAGSTTITYTVSSICGTATTTAIVTVGDLPNGGTVSGASNLCVGGTVIFTSNGTGGGSWSSNNPAAATVDPVTGLVTGGSAGSATISYTVSSTCGSSVSSANITISALPNAGLISGSSSVCAGSTTALTTNGSGGGIWSSNNNLVASINPATGVVTGVAAGSATITYTVTNTCGTASAITTINIDALPNSGIVSGPSTLCTGITAAFTSTGTGGGSWSSSNTSIATVDPVTGAVTGLAAGSATISYTATSVNCGSSISSANITINPSPNPGSLSGSAAVCAGSVTTFTSDGTINGTWNSDNTSVATVDANGVVTGVAAGSTSITYTVTNGCGTLSAAKVITVNPLADAGTISGSGTLCAGGATTTFTTDGLSGGTWSSDNTLVATVNAAGLVTGLSAGNANITYSVTTPCGTATSIAAVSVTALPNAGNITGSSTVCAGATTTYTSDGFSGGIWSSVTPAVATVDPTTGVVTGLTVGNATIKYTFTNACGTSTASQMITVNPQANGGIVTGAASVCIGAQATFSSNGLSGGTWSSSNALAASVDPSTGVVTGNATGNAIITYTSTTPCGTATASSGISVIVTPDAGTVSGNATVCVGSTTLYSSSGMTGGTWSSVTPSVATVDANGVVTGVSAGNATIVYTFSNACGSTTASQMITVNPQPNAGTVSGATTVCVGSQATFTTNGLVGGTWSSSSPAIATVNPSTGVVVGIAAGSTTITYTSNTPCGTVTASAYITVSPVVNAGTVNGTSTLCIGTSTPYTSNGTAGGTWSSVTPSVAMVNASTGVVTGVSTGNATITYTVNGCGVSSASKTIAVSMAANPGTLSGPASVCAGSTALLTRSGGSGGGTWSSSNTSVATVNSSGSVTGVSDGTAVISYSVASGCGTSSATKSITVNQIPGLVANNITVSTDLNECSALLTLGSNITVSGSPATTLEYRIGVLWFSFPISSAHRFYRGTTPVTVRASNSCGSVMKIFLVTVVDNQPPTINCLPNTTRSANGNSGKYAVRGKEFNISASDGCGVASMIYSLSGATVKGFSSSNTSLNNVKLNVGATTITWRATDVNGNVSTCSTVVTVTGNSSNNFSRKVDDRPTFKVDVAPNPSSYYFTLQFRSESSERLKISVVDVTGRTVEQLSNIWPNGTLRIGDKYHPGIYSVKVAQGEYSVSLKLIKQGK